MVKQILPIQFIPTHVQPHAKASQSDTEERVFEFHCFTDDDIYNIPAGSTVVIKGSKPGGGTFAKAADSFSGNIVTVTCTDSMTDAAGEVPCELMVTTSSGTVNSSNFILDVEGTPINEEAVTPSDFSAFEDILRQVTEKAIDTTNVVKYDDLLAYPNTQTAVKSKGLDAVQGNPNVVGSLAEVANNLNGLTKNTGKALMVTSNLNEMFIAQSDGTAIMYRCSSSATNKPGGSAGYGISFRHNNNYGAQLFVTHIGVYYRACRSAVWDEWQYLYFMVPESANAYSYTSLNQYTKTGYYYVYSSAGITDLPEGTNGNLLVLGLTSGVTDTGRIQVYRRVGTPGANDGNIYVRQYQQASGWGQWWRYTPDQDLVGKRAKGLWGVTVIPEGADFNDYKIPGEYYVANNNIAATISNMPSLSGTPAAGRLTVEYTVNNGSAYIRQTYANYTSNYVYWVRTSGNGGSAWTRWYSYGGILTSSNNTNPGVSIPSGLWTKVIDVPFTGDQGIYLLDAHLRFPVNKTGIRAFSIQNITDDNPDPSPGNNNQADLVNAVDGGYTICHMSRMVSVGPTVKGLRFSAFQNSGSALTAIIYTSYYKLN